MVKTGEQDAAGAWLDCWRTVGRLREVRSDPGVPIAVRLC